LKVFFSALTGALFEVVTTLKVTSSPFFRSLVLSKLNWTLLIKASALLYFDASFGSLVTSEKVLPAILTEEEYAKIDSVYKTYKVKFTSSKFPYPTAATRDSL